MAVVFIQQRKIQRNLILIFIGVILVTAFVLWLGFFKEEKITPPKEPFEVRKEIKIDFGVLKNPLLKALQSFSEIEPLEEEKLGRENPFLPY